MRVVPPVSIVIPALNEEGYLPVLLDSLSRIEFPLDIIVVDGESTDKTIQVAEAFSKKFAGKSSLRVISSPRGIGLQRNHGAELAAHNILIFCDADIIVPSQEMYARIIRDFVEHDCVVAGPRFKPIEPGFLLQIEHGLLNLLLRVLHLLKKAFVPGGYLLTTKKIFIQTGGFDTRIKLAEDVDYSMRAAQFGPAKLLEGHVRVSARRVIKYGYSWLFKDVSNIAMLLTKGRIRDAEKIFYPFGDF